MFDTDTDKVPAMMPGDIICDVSARPEITYYTCNDPTEGGLMCSEYNPISHTSATDIEAAWSKTSVTGDVLMIPPENAWWEQVDAILDMACFDYTESTNVSSSTYYKFKMGDYACDIGIVFMCMSPADCQTT